MNLEPIAALPFPRIRRWGVRILLLAVVCAGGGVARAQRKPMDPPSTLDTSKRTRLILKDGTYQVVLTYKVDGGIVRYRSAERAGEVEEIPLALVDLPATKKWEKEHAADAAQASRARLLY